MDVGCHFLIEQLGTEMLHATKLAHWEGTRIEHTLAIGDADVSLARDDIAQIFDGFLGFPFRRLFIRKGVQVGNGDIIGRSGQVVLIHQAKMLGETEQDFLVGYARRHVV